MTSHGTYNELFRDSAEGPIASDEIIAVNAKIEEQFASVAKSNHDLFSLIYQLFEDCIGGLAMIVRDHEGRPRLHLVHGIRCFLPGITGLFTSHPTNILHLAISTMWKTTGTLP